MKCLAGSCFASLVLISTSSATLIQVQSDDFTSTPQFSSVRIFDFAIEIAGQLRPGVTYNNPALIGIDYQVRGPLAAGTPSGFSAFNLQRPEAGQTPLTGAEFYGQGSSLIFTLSAAADLSDGFQVTDLEPGTSFVFDGREVNTGRYHPTTFTLNRNGTGIILNSNNSGGVNPQTGREVNVQQGDEFITQLSFDPGLTLAPAPVPEPSSALLLGVAGLLGLRRRR